MTRDEIRNEIREFRAYCSDGVPGRHYPDGLECFLTGVEEWLQIADECIGHADRLKAENERLSKIVADGVLAWCQEKAAE